MTVWGQNLKMSSNGKIGLISMCRKAGKLIMGMDKVREACAAGTAKAVFTASDFSPKSLKEIKFVCYKYNVELYALEMTMDEIGYGLGKRTGVVAMTDGGFAKSCKKGLQPVPINEDEFYGI